MKYIKTYEGLFDFFKVSEDDKIAMSYIDRLKKVKGISPYTIEQDINNHDGFDLVGYDITFDDTPIRSTSIISNRSRGFDERSQKYLKEQGAVRRNDNEFYALSVNCEGDKEMVYAKAYLLKELNDLCKKVYDNDKDAKRIKKITSNMNPAADLNESASNPFIWFGDLQDEIMELLANLLDDEFQVLIGKVHDPKGIEITIDKRDSPMPRLSFSPSPFDKGSLKFKWVEVKPEIERMMEYLNDRFIINDIKLYTSASSSRSFDGFIPSKFENFPPLVFISIKLIFKK